MVHTYLGETMDFNVIYKRHKNIGIYIDVYGHIEVRAPKDTPVEYILQLIESKWRWINQTSREMKDRLEGNIEKVYDNDEVFLYLGKTCPIIITQDTEIKKDYVELEENILHIYVKHQEDERIRQVLKRFYYQQCKALVQKSIKAYQGNFKVKPYSISISDNNSTWGTCDTKRQFTFNWKLAMAPREVIDYVVVHEMCHMVHMNHDRSFWRLVGKIIPDYEKKQEWLARSNWKMTI